jgi:putative toxin-antitoxin system antitoxin component (TIGR02293 family)
MGQPYLSGFIRDCDWQFAANIVGILTPYSIEESDRVVRLTRIQALAEDVFGDVQRANRWLREPLGILDGKSPLEVARTEAGARLIEQLLAKLDWGAAA